MNRIFLSLVVALGLVGQVAAQTFSPLPVSTSWLPQGRLSSPISVTTSSSATLLPTTGQTAWLCNLGANDAYLAFGTSNLITATVGAGSWLKAASCGTYARNPTTSTLNTYVAAIGSGGSTTIFVETGLGTPPAQLSTGGSSGVSVTQGTSPWVSSITQWAGGTLGAMGTYGTSPGAVLVPGVNAFVTGGTITANIGTLNGAATAANQTTGNASLASIDTKMSALTTAVGAAPMQMTGGVVGITGGVAVTGTFWQATQPTSIASAQVASGAFLSGSIGSGAMVDLGAIADAAATAGSTGTVNSKLRLMTTQLGTLNTTLGTPMQQTGGSVSITGTATISGTVTANAGTNLNTSLLALETGGNLATAATNTGTTNTNLGAPGATVCATDTGSCSLNALLQRIASRLSTVNTTLASPFQAGGSIGNTSFAATQATAANLNATVVGTGTFAVQAAQNGTWNITNVSGTISLPTGASTSANQILANTPITPATATATAARLLGMQYNSTQATFTNGQQGSVQGSSRGALYVATGADTFNVTVNAALPAGTAILGKVGIDQTTPGTTNLVALTAETTKVIGTVNVAAAQTIAVTNAGTFATQSAITAASGAIAAGAQVDLLTMRGTKAAGTAAANSLLGGAVYNSTVPALTDGQQVADQTDTAGSRQVNTEGKKTTYSASSNVTLAAAATDVACFGGSASKTVRVTRIQISGQATAATNTIFYLVKRSTATTGGTSAAFTVTPHDSANAAGTMTATGYSANPTTGTLVGTMRLQQMTMTTGAGAIPQVPIIWTFGDRNSQSGVLRGTAQQLCIFLNGATVAGGVASIDVEATEEN